MTMQLTEQEKMFLDRVALAIVKDSLTVDEDSILSAAAKVTAQDRKLVSLLTGRMRDKAVPHFADRAWKAMQ